MKAPSLLLALAVGAFLQARANPVLEWNALVVDAIRVDNSGPNLSSRNLAILHAAVFDAVNSVRRTHQPHRSQLPSPGEVSLEAAVVGASHEVARRLYPVFAAKADALRGRFVQSHAAGPPLVNGLALGKRVAELALRDREDDGMATETHYIPSAEPGQWRRTGPHFRPPSTPHWRNVRLFALPDKDSFLPPPPPRLDSPEYAAAFNEVKTLGSKNSPVRTPDQTQAAHFWADFSHTSMPPGHWHQIAASICRERKTPLAETARLFALLSIAQADAAIVCWEAKYRSNLWRPVTAIQRGDDDGNPATAQDEKWDSLLAAPPFPAHVSGHSVFSGASATVLARFFGTDDLAFTATSDTLPGVQRHFSSFTACADEIGLSRIYGGIHFAFDNIEGKAAGARIGEHISHNILQRVSE